VVAASVGAEAMVLNTDEWGGYARVESRIGIAHSTVRHGRDEQGRREWARDDDGDGIREVHCNGCEGVGAPLRTFLRVFRGVHKKHLGEYVASFETMTNAKRITGEILRLLCASFKSLRSQRRHEPPSLNLATGQFEKNG
jgi:transposase